MEILLSIFQWLRESLCTLFIVCIFSFWLKSFRYKLVIVRLLGLYMLLSAWVLLYYCYCLDSQYAFYYALPLHVCSLTTLLCGISVFINSQFLLESIYYFGLIGAYLALLFPIYVHERTGFLFLDYFIGHGLMIVIVHYHISKGFIPRKRSAIRCYGTFLLAACLIFLFNYIFGTNYWFINENPGFRVALITSVWPYYLIEWFVLGLIFLWFLERRFKKHH